MSSPIEVVVLDLGGVVCRYVPDRRLRALSRLTGTRPGEVHAALWASGLDARAEAGDLDHDEAYDAVLERMGPGVSGNQLREAWSTAFEPVLDVLELVGALDRPTVLFTNNGPIFEDCLANELDAVGSAFDTVLLSWRLGATKPGREAFARATSRIGVAPSSVLFVDDSRDNIRAAAHQGWIAHPYRGLARLRRLFEAHELVEAV